MLALAGAPWACRCDSGKYLNPAVVKDHHRITGVPRSRAASANHGALDATSGIPTGAMSARIRGPPYTASCQYVITDTAEVIRGVDGKCCDDGQVDPTASAIEQVGGRTNCEHGEYTEDPEQIDCTRDGPLTPCRVQRFAHVSLTVPLGGMPFAAAPTADADPSAGLMLRASPAWRLPACSGRKPPSTSDC